MGPLTGIDFCLWLFATELAHTSFFRSTPSMRHYVGDVGFLLNMGRLSPSFRRAGRVAVWSLVTPFRHSKRLNARATMSAGDIRS